MRPIKFRVWDKSAKKWLINFDVSPEGIVFDYSETILEDVELVQFTGLHDKNGKEIYEGDIVQYTEKSYPMDVDGWGKDMHTPGFKGDKPQIDVETAVVEYCDDRSEFRMKRWNGSRNLYERELEVIGNIMENPELLNGGK